MKYWLLDLDVGGEVLRFSTERLEVPVEVPGSPGSYTLAVYSAGLADPGVSMGAIAGIGDVTLSVSIDADGVDWPALANAGHLDGRAFVLRRWDPDEGFGFIGNAAVILRGLTAEIAYGAEGERVTLSLVREASAFGASVPPDRAAVDSTTWGSAYWRPAVSDGVAYPVVIGCPGDVAEKDAPIPVVPIPVVDWVGEGWPVLETETFTSTGPLDNTFTTAYAINSTDHAEFAVSVNGLGVAYGDIYTVIFPGSGYAEVTINDPPLVNGDAIVIIYRRYNGDNALTRSRAVWIGGHASGIMLGVLAGDSGEGAGHMAKAAIPTSSLTDDLGRTVSGVVQTYPLVSPHTVPKIVTTADYSLDTSVITYGYGKMDDRYFAGFKDSALFGGGVLTHRGELLRGAGDVVEWVLRNYYLGPVDRARTAAARDQLNAFKIDTWIAEQVNAWEWLQREILPLLPVEMREGNDGIYPAVVRFDLTGADVVMSIREGENASRTGAVSFSAGEIANEFTVLYQPIGSGAEEWRSRRVVTGNAKLAPTRITPQGLLDAVVPDFLTLVSDDPRVTSHPLCIASQARYGVRAKEIKAWAVWDDTTAVRVAQSLADRYAWRRRRVAYDVEDGERLEIGSAVVVTDPAMGWADVLAVVADLTPGAVMTSVDLLILDDPVRV